MGYLVGMVQYTPSLHPGLTQKDNICYPLFPLDEKGRYNRPQTVRHGDFLWGFMLDLMLLYLTFLPVLLYILQGQANKSLNYVMEYKRKYRELSDETKEKIAAANRNRPKSQTHRQRISQAMKDYWRQVPHRPISGI